MTLPASPITPEMVPLPRAPAVFGLSRSGLYRLAASVRAFLASLPAAEIRGAKPAAADPALHAA
jgi:hypothetical protein